MYTAIKPGVALKTSPGAEGVAADARQAIFLCNSDGCFIVRLNEVVYCMSFNSSTEFHMANGRKIVVARSIKHFEGLLLPYRFIRVHQSYLINVHHLSAIIKADGCSIAVMSGCIEVSVSRQKRNQVVRLIRTMFLDGH